MKSENSSKNERYFRNCEIFLPGNEEAYQRWRLRKLAKISTGQGNEFVKIGNLSRPLNSEISAVISQCKKTNMVLYSVGEPAVSAATEAQTQLRMGLKKFCNMLGLYNAETHRSQGDDGVVAIEVDNRGTGAGYIPYTNRALSWHTDGYYNAPASRIRAMVLHCARNANEGGVNEMLDQEIAYLRLRDADPAFIEAFMNEKAMSIPANNDTRSGLRPISTGPVFFLDQETGALNMRYSARARNIIWRDDANTEMARAKLGEILASDPLIIRHKLKSGQGVISNNVLHNRTGFTSDNERNRNPSGRLVYRLRFMDRVGEKLSNTAA
jgi:alpha-ketoglutarate-dependent taurine dioxygenase